MTNTVLQEIAKQLKNYTGVKQVILANQKIPESKLDRPRLVLDWNSRGGTNYPHTHIEKEKSFSEEDNKITIERSTYFNYTLNIRLIGKEIDDYIYIEKARDWFELPYLSDETLRQFKGSVIEILAIDDLSSFSQTEYQFEYNLDIVINFGKYYEYDIDNIEEVNINGE